MHTIMSSSVSRGLKPFAVTTILGLLAACDNGNGDGGPYTRYAVERDIGLQGAPADVTPPFSAATPAAVASAGSLLLELSDELDDYIDDLAELRQVQSGACRDGGSVTVNETQGNGTLTRTLDFDQCQAGDDFHDGRLVLECAAATCAGDGRLVFGNGGTAFIDQELDDAAVSRILLGEIRFSGYADEFGRLTIDLAARFENREGLIGEARFDDFVYESSRQSASLEQRRYDGTLRYTAFSTPGGCVSTAGRVEVSTAPVLVVDDERDRSNSGEIALGGDGSGKLVWNQGSVVATAADDSSQTLEERALDRLCDF